MNDYDLAIELAERASYCRACGDVTRAELLSAIAYEAAKRALSTTVLTSEMELW